MKKFLFSGSVVCFSSFAFLLLGAAYAAEQPSQSGDDNISLQELLNIQVTTASKTEEKLSDAPGVISVVTKDEIKRFGGNTLADVLDRVPSLSSMTAFFQDRSLISVRGDQYKVTSGHVLLLLNGRPVRESMEGGITSETFESFPIGIIERIEVIRGPGSVLYGSNAFSGVINIITEDPDKIGGSVSGQGGLKGEWGANGDFKLNAGGVKLLAAVRAADESWKVSKYTQTKVNLPVPSKTYSLTFPDEQVGTYASVEYKGIKLQSSYDRWHAQYFLRGQLGENVWGKMFNDLGYNLNVTKIWNMSFNVTYTNSTLESDTGYPYVNRNSYDLVTEWTNYVQISDKSKLVLGGLFNQIKGKEDFKGWSGLPAYVAADSKINAYAGYAQIDYWLLQSLKLIGGVQTNKVGSQDIDVVPRAGAIWYALDKLSVKALYGQAYRAPSINETTINHPGLRGTANLKPEKVGTLDIGLNYNADNFQAGVNYYYSDQKDIITLSQANPQYRQYQNMTEINYQGVEFESKYYLNTNLFLTGSMLYQVNKDTAGFINKIPTATWYKKVGISYMDNKGITLSLFDVFNNGLDTSYSGTINPGPKPMDIMDLNCAFDFSKFFKLHGPDYALNLYVENFMNTPVWAPEWGGILHQSVPVSPGRRIYISAKVSL
jgi:outer membrane receptor for ferrienterochelin and colicins